MSTTAYNSQFLQLDFRLIDDPAFLAFLRSSASAVYLLLVRHIWRGRRPHRVPLVNDLRRQGHLVASVRRETIASRLALTDQRSVSRLLRRLEKTGLVERRQTGRETVYVLGTWEDKSFARDGSFIDETLFLYRRFGPDGKGGSKAEVAETATSEVAETATPEVAETATPEVAEMATPFLIDKEEIDKGIENQDLEDDGDGHYVVRLSDLARTA